MLRGPIEYGNNIKEEMKVTLDEIKKIPEGTNNEGKETGIQINNLEHKEEINFQPELKEETRIQKKIILQEDSWNLQKCQHPSHRDARK